MNYDTKELKTKRLVIKKGTIEDFIKVYEYNYKKLFGINNEYKLEKQNTKRINEFFKLGMGQYYEKIKKIHCFDWIIYLKDNPIGNIFAFENKSDIEIEFRLHPIYWDNNYMYESLYCVIDYLFEVGYNNIIYSFQDGNKNAKALAFKLFFKPYDILKDVCLSDGVLVDVYKLKLTKENWLSKTGKLDIKIN